MKIKYTCLFKIFAKGKIMQGKGFERLERLSDILKHS
jgi:hypothetical protein